MATYCTHCGKKFDFGVVRYVVTVHVAADSDNVLPSGGAQEDLEAFMRSIDREESKEVEKDLHQSKAFVLCTACKNDFMNNVSTPHVRAAEGAGETSDEGSGSGEGQVH
jgi:hypothetical protein